MGNSSVKSDKKSLGDEIFNPLSANVTKVTCSDKGKIFFKISLKRQIPIKNICRLKVTKLLDSNENFNQQIFLADKISD